MQTKKPSTNHQIKRGKGVDLPFTLSLSLYSIPRHIYIICKHILLITFLNESELIFYQTVKLFQALLFNTNYFIEHYTFIYTQLNGSKYCYVSLTIK